MQDFDPELLRKYLTGQTSEAESSQVLQWLEENNLSKEDIQHVLDHPEAIWIFNEIDTPHNWSMVKKKMVVKPRVLSMRSFIRVAASLLIIVAVSGVVYKVYQHINRPFVVSNDGNQIMKVILPDSSVINLNSHSRLTYLASFSRKRTISFEGEALFDIKRDIHSPFVIQTVESEIKVLGTSFCVSTDMKNTSVIVSHGKVAFYSTHQLHDTIYLEKGDKGIYLAQSSSLEKQRNNDLNFLAWEDHHLVFEKTSMDKVIADMEKYFKIKIEVKNPEIYQLNYTSEFANPSLDEVLKEMELVLAIKAEKTGNNILLNLK